MFGENDDSTGWSNWISHRKSKKYVCCLIGPFLCLQSWPKKCVLCCVILPAGAVARSGNLGQTFLANSV